MNLIRITVLFALINFIGLSYSQMYIQATGGVNFSDLSTSDGPQDDDLVTPAELRGQKAYKKVGYNFGIAYEQFINPFLGFQAGLSFESRGEGGSIGFLGAAKDEDSSWVTRYQYYQVPIHIIGSVPTGKNQRIEILVGGELGYRWDDGEFELFGRDSADYPGSSAIYDGSKKALTDDEEFDYGYSIGLGYKMLVPFGAMYIRSTYYESLVDLNNAEQRHRNFKVQIGYGFGL